MYIVHYINNAADIVSIYIYINTYIYIYIYIVNNLRDSYMEVYINIYYVYI